MAAFLTERFGAIAPTVWQQRIAQGEVVDEHGVAVTASRPYQPHLRVYYYRALDVEPRIPFDECVVFQDEHIVVADKPHFLPVTPSGRYLQETLLVRLKRRLGVDTLAPMHRLDRETAGLVLFAVQPATRGAYHGVFMRHRVEKRYEAVAPWRSDLALPLTRHSRIEEGDRFFYQREVPGVPNATTHIELLARHGALGHYRLTPVTGTAAPAAGAHERAWPAAAGRPFLPRRAGHPGGRLQRAAAAAGALTRLHRPGDRPAALL